jgi:hypothetical protein
VAEREATATTDFLNLLQTLASLAAPFSPTGAMQEMVLQELRKEGKMPPGLPPPRENVEGFMSFLPFLGALGTIIRGKGLNVKPALESLRKSQELRQEILPKIVTGEKKLARIEKAFSDIEEIPKEIDNTLEQLAKAQKRFEDIRKGLGTGLKEFSENFDTIEAMRSLEITPLQRRLNKLDLDLAVAEKTVNNALVNRPMAKMKLFEIMQTRPSAGGALQPEFLPARPSKIPKSRESLN